MAHDNELQLSTTANPLVSCDLDVLNQFISQRWLISRVKK